MRMKELRIVKDTMRVEMPCGLELTIIWVDCLDQYPQHDVSHWADMRLDIGKPPT
jgi:hypothetical protein